MKNDPSDLELIGDLNVRQLEVVKIIQELTRQMGTMSDHDDRIIELINGLVVLVRDLQDRVSELESN